MQIDEKLLSKLENLSALKIDREKRSSIISELNEIVDFVAKLNELDLSRFESSVNTLLGGTALRMDATKPSDVIESILSQAPKSDERFFIVPKIIE